jgi:sugar (pentulose or hexulose) kinase
MQNKADVVGLPIEVPEIDEATPLGAAMIAGIGTGVYRDEEDAFAKVRRKGKTYRPTARLAKTYAEGFEIYREMYPALSALNWKIADRAQA